MSPNPVHSELRDLVRRFAREQLAPQAAVRDRDEHFASDILRRLGQIGALLEFGQIRAYLAESCASDRAGRAYLYQSAAQMEPGRSIALDADGAKLFCAAMAKTVADRAIQVLGGNGYIADYEVERLWRDARLLEIGGGTNESLRKNITRLLVPVDALEP